MARAALRRQSAGVLIAVAALLLSACGDDDDDNEAAEAGETTLTMWTRSATQAQSQRLVDAFNASHENQVELTVIPNDNYQPQIASAAGAGTLPDIFASDVIFVPNYTSQGLLLDITDRIDALPYADSLAPSHIELGTWEGRKHAVPHTLDLSVLFYNKELYRQAGLDPEQPPTTLNEFAEHARAIGALGDDIYGTFWGGDCGGCYVFTFWPSIWAGGGEVMTPDGNASTINNPVAAEVFSIYRSLWQEDGVVEPSAINETGDTWTGFFPEGNIGVMPMPSTTLGAMPEDLDFGVAPIPGPDGGESTFVGGDSVGISATSEHPDEAWEFIEWTLSEEAQVEIVAQNADVVSRTDLADNKYSSADPRVVTINEMVGKGRTPFALRFGEVYNLPTGPWLPVVRGAVFEDDPEAALRDGQEMLTAALSQ